MASVIRTMQGRCCFVINSWAQPEWKASNQEAFYSNIIRNYYNDNSTIERSGKNSRTQPNLINYKNIINYKRNTLQNVIHYNFLNQLLNAEN